MTKKQLVEIVTRHLAGGATNSDTDGKYHPKEVGFHITIAMKALAHQLAENGQGFMLGQLAKSYSDLSTANNQTELPVSPLLGQQSIMSVYGCENGTEYNSRRDGAERVVLNFLKPSCRATYTMRGKTLFWNQTPDDKTVTISFIPDFNDLGSDDNVPMPSGMEDKIVDHIINRLFQRSRLQEDMRSNQNIDSDNE